MFEMFDFHCHFFKGEKVKWKVLNTGINKESNRIVLKTGYYKALGIHPLEINKHIGEDYVESELTFIENNIESKKINAIGEIGLDFHYNKESKIVEWQKELFYRFLDLAEEKRYPVIIHSRDAEKEVIEILETYDVNAVLHSFNYRKIELIDKALDLACKFTISFTYSKKLDSFIELVPLSNLLIESDFPYKKIYQNLKDIEIYSNKLLERIAKIKKIDVNEVDKIIEKNAIETIII